ncbi:MAG: VWA domain-containing protein [Chloroflexi bacterium]|nr:VWA domain-containing protein [Chloroflexota bacterium]
MFVYRYSRWDGTQEVNPFDADDLLDQLADDLIADGDLPSAIQRVMRWGAEQRDGQRLRGLQELLEQIRSRRQQVLNRHQLGSVLDEIRERLDRIIATERAGIDKRLAESRQRAEHTGERNLLKALEGIAARKRRTLDSLPPEIGGQIRDLSDYDFMDADARQQFEDLMHLLQQQVMGTYFEGLRQQVESLRPEDLRRLREMVRDLNQMLQEKARGGNPNFQAFMQKHGQFFPPGINSLDELIEHLQRRMAQMQSLLNSMTPAMRQSLQEMIDALFRDDRLRWDLAQLAANLEHLMPTRQFRNRYPFKGDEPLTLGEALQTMEQLQGLDQLEKQLASAQRTGQLANVDADQLEEQLGKEARSALDQLQQLMKQLEEAGYIQRKGGRWELTPRAIRRIGQRALHDIFAQLKRDAFGKHATHERGAGGERVDESKPYEFGDAFHLDLRQTLMNSLVREGPGTPIRLAPADFEVFRTELLTQVATVLMVDMSRSMILRGCFAAAKKVAMALDSLIRGQFPNDSLDVLVFSDYARPLRPEMLPHVVWNEDVYGTNLQHGLLLARQLLARHKAANRQIIVITDGEPTAHLEDGIAHFSYPPTHRTIQETLREVGRCTREGIVINTFMLENGHYLVDFVNQMTKINRGRAFFATPDKLGEYILVDYVARKRKQIR